MSFVTALAASSCLLDLFVPMCFSVTVTLYEYLLAVLQDALLGADAALGA